MKKSVPWFVFAIVVRSRHSLAWLRPLRQRCSSERSSPLAPGPQRLAIDAPLLAGSAPFRVVRRGERFYGIGGLTDLRLVTDDGRAGAIPVDLSAASCA